MAWYAAAARRARQARSAGGTEVSWAKLCAWKPVAAAWAEDAAPCWSWGAFEPASPVLAKPVESDPKPGGNARGARAPAAPEPTPEIPDSDESMVETNATPPSPLASAEAKKRLFYAKLGDDASVRNHTRRAGLGCRAL